MRALVLVVNLVVHGAVIVAVVGAVSACTGSSEPTGPPSLDRIDGPAVVDPSFDPFATIPPSTDVGG
jgi:hypothetical protein